MKQVRSFSAVVAACLAIGLATANSHAQALTADTLKAGQAIEVREGDDWSPATFVRKEGRKLLIKYSGEGGTEEWVTIDRIRQPGSAKPGDPKAADPKGADAKPGAEKTESKNRTSFT